MTPQLTRSPLVRTGLAIGTGFLASCVIASGAQRFGLSAPPEPGYPMTGLFSGGFLWVFVVGGAVVGFIVGGWCRCTWPVALGMILPLPIATAIEVSRDPTSHNMFPFEVLFVWVPGFVIPFLTAFVGARSRGSDSVGGSRDQGQ